MRQDSSYLSRGLLCISSLTTNLCFVLQMLKSALVVGTLGGRECHGQQLGHNTTNLFTFCGLFS